METSYCRFETTDKLTNTHQAVAAWNPHGSNPAQEAQPV